MLKTGKVLIIGIGPGDPNLVTVRARELIELADVIIYDYIADPKLLEWSREDAKTICVGKTAEQNAVPKEEVGFVESTNLRSRIWSGGPVRPVLRTSCGEPFGRLAFFLSEF